MSCIRKFATPHDLKTAIDKYFKDTPDIEQTFSGLALLFGSKELMSKYLTKDTHKEYRQILRDAKLRVEDSYERDLRKHSKVGDIFALKNQGWRDRQELTGKDGKPIPFAIVDYKPKKEKNEKNT